ncbi:MAG: hypothetical protein CHACPFDD_00191 [Phycisphaerae bacterium]|nr:hypothetical protein [Phycisphaerae bacterium]
MNNHPHHARPAALVASAALLTLAAFGVFAIAGDGPSNPQVNTPMVVFGYNDLGMHCMNPDYSEIIILPPFNTLHAQVIDRSEGEPDIVTEGVTVEYRVPSNTHSADKTNFWKFWPPQFGPPQPPNVGLTGSRMSGTMSPTGHNDWAVVGIPIVPTDDLGRDSPYPLATITVKKDGNVVARTQSVVPVSTEITCNLCHNTPGISTATDVLRAHDRMHGTTLESQKPVLCANCHADNALGLPGQSGVPNFSSAMHSAHAPRMGGLGLAEVCYACHPGIRTQCQRDVHMSNGIGCSDCHGDMAAVGDPARNPWLEEPRCGSCHSRPGFEFEQPNTLYRNSVGHKNVHCAACHGSPHAITPTTTTSDNVQATLIQGYPGTINNCTVCHINGPPGQFFHKVDD